MTISHGHLFLIILYLIPRGAVFNREGLLLILKCVLGGPVLIVKAVQAAFTIILGPVGRILRGVGAIIAVTKHTRKLRTYQEVANTPSSPTCLYISLWARAMTIINIDKNWCNQDGRVKCSMNFLSHLDLFSMAAKHRATLLRALVPVFTILIIQFRSITTQAATPTSAPSPDPEMLQYLEQVFKDAKSLNRPLVEGELNLLPQGKEGFANTIRCFFGELVAQLGSCSAGACVPFYHI